MTQAMHQVLIIEDEPAIRAVLRVLLTAAGYRCIEADTALRAEIEARSHKPDLLLVDLGLPDDDGLKVIRKVRAWSPVPIVVLSARTMEEQKVAALDAGADDYVTKPFGADELLARLRAALRRSVRASGPESLLDFGAVHIDLARRVAQGADGEIHLTPLEYRVLGCLAGQLGSIVTQRQLIREVWGPGREHDSRSLRVCIKNLRSKIEPEPGEPRYLITETGLGYRLRADESAAA
ncbi:MAG TPA: response regulator [Steroidobacteraceae bacterium]|jgi:two-component system KDP operon response regulator KdpE|nr:response regulator [Steroidobacteraceae bacterium]